MPKKLEPFAEGSTQAHLLLTWCDKLHSKPHITENQDIRSQGYTTDILLVPPHPARQPPSWCYTNVKVLSMARSQCPASQAALSCWCAMFLQHVKSISVMPSPCAWLHMWDHKKVTRTTHCRCIEPPLLFLVSQNSKGMKEYGNVNSSLSTFRRIFYETTLPHAWWNDKIEIISRTEYVNQNLLPC